MKARGPRSYGAWCPLHLIGGILGRVSSDSGGNLASAGSASVDGREGEGVAARTAAGSVTGPSGFSG